MNKPETIRPVESTDESSEVNRHPGISYQQIIAADRIAPPPVLAHEHYQNLGSEDLSPQRYSSPEFFDREMDHVWKRTWQWACRVEHIPEAGDYYVYDIGKYSILVVRGENDDVKAFYNFCMHRGTKLRVGEGCGHARRNRPVPSMAGDMPWTAV